jgi:glycosyltransferase involved in cell wall biosynthesis
VKIALISYDWGEYCIRLASELARNHEVCLLIPNQMANPHLALLNPSVRFQPFDKPRLRQPLRQIRVLMEFRRVLNEWPPDIIHVQQGHLWFNLAMPLLARGRLVLTIHDPRHHLGDQGSQKTPQALYDFGFRQASEVIVHAEEMSKVVSSEIGIPNSRLTVIPHIYLGEDGEPNKPTNGDPSMILFFGRIWPYKGLEYLIRAEPLISAKVPDVKIVIAGRGEDFERYRRMMSNPDRFVVYNDYVSNEDRKRLFAEAAVIVLPYLEATQSGVVPLAYAFQKPVVATAVGGLPEMIEDGKTGYLVRPKDVEGLADAVLDLLLNPSRRAEFGENGRKKLLDQCSPPVVAAQTLAVYERALANRLVA